jgi:hypothetical protein
VGTVRIGQEAFLFLRWDKANKRFIGGMKRVGYRPVTATISYSLDDSTPPPGLYKGISVRNSAPNCTSTPAFAHMEALVDDVVVNVPWEP